MKFLTEWLNAGRAKRAAECAYRCKYPDRPQGLMIPWPSASDADVYIFFVSYHKHAELIVTWWSVTGSDFAAVEIDAPADLLL